DSSWPACVYPCWHCKIIQPNYLLLKSSNHPNSLDALQLKVFKRVCITVNSVLWKKLHATSNNIISKIKIRLSSEPVASLIFFKMHRSLIMSFPIWYCMDCALHCC